ncbi:adenylate cyclase type 10 [Eleutherodactylus coqui]|uniref:adenylate cyclase type 10 n=1 Tax=Eleutherodactylus coqui TaxID=57060 RepID=UPI0034623920
MEEETVLSTLGKVAAHVPDLVIYGNPGKKLPCVEDFHGVLIFADISGFTALTEKFSSTNKKGYGADQLTKTLNSYMADIVDRKWRNGGDISHLSGDAVLALWKIRRDQLSDVITLTVNCSMEIQENCGVRATNIGVELSVKIAISAGRLSQIVKGNKTEEFFVVVGRAVNEVRLAECLAEASSIILSPSAWELCDRQNFLTEKIPNERAVKLRYIKRKTNFDLEVHLQEYGSHLTYEPISLLIESYRKVLLLCPNPSLEQILRKYVMETVLRKLDDDQPLEYLSEMTSVTVLFLNFQFCESASIELLCQAMQDVTIGVLNQITKYRGRINKIFTFDKGCTFLCVFGLPGDKQEDDCAHALHCAFTIYGFCSEDIESIRLASISLTSGPVFCGVVGHATRHEYTVIGRKVNLAARMMMHYPGLVACDQETYQESKFPAYLFSELPPKEMKGVVNPGTLYQYLESKEATSQFTTTSLVRSPLKQEEPHETVIPDLDVNSYFYGHIAGRDKEIDVFRHTIREFIHSKDWRWKDCQRSLVYEGAHGLGKSQILAEINYLAQCDDYRVIALELSKMNRKQPLYAMQNLMAIFLHIDVCKGFAQREKVLMSKISDGEDVKNLCLLNNIFLVKFPITEEVSLMDQHAKYKETEKVMIRILQQAAEKETIMCIIDDAQYLDAASWEFLSEITDSVPVFLVMALCPFYQEKQLSSAAAHVLKSPNTIYVHLKELEPDVISDIICHSLGVISIPSELEILLIERSHGVPYYLNELLKSLCYNKILVLEPMEKEEGDEVDNLLKQIKSCSQVPNLEQKRTSLSRWMSMVQEQTENRIFSCKLNSAVNLQNIPLPYPLKGIGLSQFDNMTAAQQIVVKCAAPIGQKFSTVQLNHILPEGTRAKLKVTIDSLVKSHVFECAMKSNGQERRSQVLTHTHLCCCPSGTLEEGKKEWPCRVMHFCSTLLQETANELWLWKQRRSLHHKCAVFLEPHSHRCQQCGETRFDGSENVQPMVPPISEGDLSVPVDHHDYVGSLAGNNHTLNLLYVLEQSLVNGQSFIMYRAELKFLQRMDSFLQTLGTREPSSLVGCSCNKILEAVVSPLANHWIEVGNRAKSIYYLLESANAAMHISNNYLALSFLNKAETLLTDKKKRKKSEEWDQDYKQEISRFETACMYGMKGEVLFNLGQVENAEILLRKSLHYLQRWFPSSVPEAAVKLLVENAKIGLKRCWRQAQEMRPAEYRELVSFVGRMESLINTYHSVKLQAWFYIICLDLLLEGGFAFRGMDDCLKFVDNFHTHSIISLENQIKLNLFSSLALWFCRLQEWDLIQSFFQMAKILLPQTSSSFFTLCGFSKLLECQVLVLRKTMEEQSEDWDIVSDNTDQDCWFENLAQDSCLEAAAEMPLWQDIAGTDTEVLIRRKFLLKPFPVPVAETPETEEEPDANTDTME